VSASSEVLAAAVALPNDLHARPAGEVTRTAARFDATVTLAVRDKIADARSVLAVMSLGARKAEVVEVRAEGLDAGVALAAVVTVLETPEAPPG
jgi:phosphotransferase system HPr (HPr) family protein